MSRDLPWMKFDPVKFSDDPKLRMCSRPARSFYIDLLKLMHHSEPYGHALVDGLRPTHAQLASMFGDTEENVSEWIGELVAAGMLVFALDGIQSPQLVAQREGLELSREAGRKGGNPTLTHLADLNAEVLKAASKREKDAERQRRARQKKRESRCETSVTVTRDSVTCHAPERDASRDSERDERENSPDNSTSVTGLTHPSNLRLLESLDESNPAGTELEPTSLRALEGKPPNSLRDAIAQRKATQAQREPTLPLPPVLVASREQAA